MYQRLAIKYPHLFEKSSFDEIYVEEGWEFILDAMFNTIYTDVWHTEGALHFAKMVGDTNIDELEANFQEAVKNLPNIRSIKEKYAVLNVSVFLESPEVLVAIRFAETICHGTCERCGNRGAYVAGNWEKMYCKHHHNENGTF